MREESGQDRQHRRPGIFSWWFWLWLAAGAAYTIPVTYYADASRPSEKEITRAWIYDSLVLIAQHKGVRDGVGAAVFPLVPEDQQLKVIAEYWQAEAAAYRATYRIEPAFLEPVEVLNARYRARLAGVPTERVEAQVRALRTWVLPVAGGFLILVLAYLRRLRKTGYAGTEPALAGARPGSERALRLPGMLMSAHRRQ